MKIVFMHMTMGLSNRGSEVVVDSLATELSKQHKVLVIHAGELPQKPYETKRVYPLSHPPTPAPTNLLEKLLFRLHLDGESGQVVQFTQASLLLLRQYHPDVIIPINGSLQLRLLRSQNLGAKLVCFGHAGIGHHDRDTLRASPDMFVALTPSSFSWAQTLAYSHCKVRLIPNPLVHGKAHKIKLALGQKVVMTAGALSAYKNILNIVKAIRFTSASLLLIGDGEQSLEIAKELSTLPNEFKWLKSVEPSEMPSYYASSDIFCFVPSQQEAFGMVYLEAMAAGLPIIASDDQIRREIVGSRGTYVYPDDIHAIADAINNTNKQPKLDYTHELAPYGITRVVTQLEQELNDLLK